MNLVRFYEAELRAIGREVVPAKSGLSSLAINRFHRMGCIEYQVVAGKRRGVLTPYAEQLLAKVGDSSMEAGS